MDGWMAAFVIVVRPSSVRSSPTLDHRGNAFGIRSASLSLVGCDGGGAAAAADARPRVGGGGRTNERRRAQRTHAGMLASSLGIFCGVT